MSEEALSTSQPAEAPPRKPWARRPKQPMKFYRLQMRYLEMGEKRSLRAVAEEAGISPKVLERQSKVWGWGALAEAWDTEQAAILQALVEQRSRRALEAEARLLQNSVIMMDLDIETEVAIRDDERARGIPPHARKRMPLREAAALLKATYDQLRLARGQATTIVEEPRERTAEVLKVALQKVTGAVPERATAAPATERAAPGSDAAPTH